MSQNCVPAEVFPPGDFLREEIEARGWTQEQFAEILGRPIQTVNQILGAKKRITPETAVEIAAAFGTSPTVWLNLENQYRLHGIAPKKDVARRAKIAAIYPYSDAAKLGWVASTSDPDERESEVCRVLRIGSLEATPRCRIAAGKSDGYQEISIKQRAWAFRCLELAEKMECPSFDADAFRTSVSRENYAALTLESDGLRRIGRLLLGTGVRLLIVPAIKGSKIDGAAFWLDEKRPAIALTVRLDRVDNLWFTLFHEIAHLLQGYRATGRLDIDLFSQNPEELPKHEQEANDKAAALLIPAKTYAGFMHGLSEARIRAFAEECGVHPSIVLGRLQFEGRVSFKSVLSRKLHEKATDFHGFFRESRDICLVTKSRKNGANNDHASCYAESTARA